MLVLNSQTGEQSGFTERRVTTSDEIPDVDGENSFLMFNAEEELVSYPFDIVPTDSKTREMCGLY